MAHSPTTATARAASGTLARAMKLGTSLRFLYPTGPQTYERFKEALLRLEPGGFIERPMGAFDTAEQARNVLEIAAARAADLTGCSSAQSRGRRLLCELFSPCHHRPAHGRHGNHARRHGVLVSLPAHRAGGADRAPRRLCPGSPHRDLANGGRAAFDAFGMVTASRARRLGGTFCALLAGRRDLSRAHSRWTGADQPRAPACPWSLAGRHRSRRGGPCGHLGDGWLTGQNAPDDARPPARGVSRGRHALAGLPGPSCAGTSSSRRPTRPRTRSRLRPGRGLSRDGQGRATGGQSGDGDRAAPLPGWASRRSWCATSRATTEDFASRPHRPARDAGHRSF